MDDHLIVYLYVHPDERPVAATLLKKSADAILEYRGPTGIDLPDGSYYTELIDIRDQTN